MKTRGSVSFFDRPTCTRQNGGRDTPEWEGGLELCPELSFAKVREGSYVGVCEGLRTYRSGTGWVWGLPAGSRNLVGCSSYGIGRRLGEDSGW